MSIRLRDNFDFHIFPTLQTFPASSCCLVQLYRNFEIENAKKRQDNLELR